MFAAVLVMTTTGEAEPQLNAVHKFVDFLLLALRSASVVFEIIMLVWLIRQPSGPGPDAAWQASNTFGGGPPGSSHQGAGSRHVSNQRFVEDMRNHLTDEPSRNTASSPFGEIQVGLLDTRKVEEKSDLQRMAWWPKNAGSIIGGSVMAIAAILRMRTRNSNATTFSGSWQLDFVLIGLWVSLCLSVANFGMAKGLKTDFAWAMAIAGIVPGISVVSFYSLKALAERRLKEAGL